MTYTRSSSGRRSRGFQHLIRPLGAFLFLSPLLAQEESPPEPKSTLELKVELGREEEVYHFHVDGKAPLPDDARVDLVLYYLERRTDSFGEPYEDEAHFYRHGEIVTAIGVLKEGKFDARLGSFRRKPYPLVYRVRATYDPSRQLNTVAQAISDEHVGFSDLKLGSPEDLEKELAAAIPEILRDFDEIEVRFHELQSKFTQLQAAESVHVKEWEGWRSEWRSKVEALRARNDERFEVWALWAERSSKLWIDALSRSLLDLVGIVSDLLTNPGQNRQEKLTRAQMRMQQFLDHYHRSREALGFEKLPSMEEVKPYLDIFRKALEKKEEFEKSYSEVARAALALIPLLPKRRVADLQDFLEAFRDRKPDAPAKLDLFLRALEEKPK